ncbi:MAG: hypothetical protein DMF59_08990 [Acidobacteria bacterium]|nr:MAG: hypothetical protein DMF59_08990 [Acidobacteriota bacterium]
METLDAEHLRSVAALWRTTHRELRTSFQGSSMRPTIEPGETVILRCTDSVAPGDVVASFIDWLRCRSTGGGYSAATPTIFATSQSPTGKRSSDASRAWSAMDAFAFSTPLRPRAHSLAR